MADKNDAEREIESKTSKMYKYKKDFKTALPQILAVCVKNLVLLVYGMTLGFPTILIPAVQNPAPHEELHLMSSEISWISSMNLIVVPIGCAISGVITTPLGRRRAMQAVNIPFCIAWLVFYFSSSAAHLYIALFLTGFAGGLLEAPVLTYVAEITQPHLRGALTATSSMCIIIGVFMQFLFGLLMYWRIVALVNIIFTVAAVIALHFVPESPHWLVSKNRMNEAQKSLQWLRGWTQPHMVQEELWDIQDLFKSKQVDGSTDNIKFLDKVNNLMDRNFIMPYFLVSFAFFVGHFSGMTTLQTYAVTIFQMLEAPVDKYYATLILGIVQIIGSATCVLLVHYTGKRPLTLFSTVGGGVCCLLVAGYDYYIKMSANFATMPGLTSSTNITSHAPEYIENPYSWVPLTLLLVLAFITHTGIRLLPWILIGEVFSAKTRSSAAGLSSAIGYIFGFITNKTFISMVTNLALWGTYSLYGITCLVGAVVFYFILPETEGKKLSEIEDHFAGIKRLNNNVYKSKNDHKNGSARQAGKDVESPRTEAENNNVTTRI